MVLIIENKVFDKFTEKYNLPVKNIKLSDKDLSTKFNSTWMNEEESKYVSTSDVIVKLLKDNQSLERRIKKLEEIIEKGVAIDDEDRAYIAIKYK